MSIIAEKSTIVSFVIPEHQKPTEGINNTAIEMFLFEFNLKLCTNSNNFQDAMEEKYAKRNVVTM